MRDLKLNSSSDEIYGKNFNHREERLHNNSNNRNNRQSPVKSARDVTYPHNQDKSSLQLMDMSKNSQLGIETYDKRIDIGSQGYTEQSFSIPLTRDAYEIKQRKILAQSSLMQLNVNNYDVKQSATEFSSTFLNESKDYSRELKIPRQSYKSKNADSTANRQGVRESLRQKRNTQNIIRKRLCEQQSAL